MKEKVIAILKEIGIALVMLVILGAVTVGVFYDKIPFGKEIPKGEEYAKVNKEEYSVSSHDRLAEVKAITVTHEANGNQITQAENDVRLSSGKYTPFGTISGTSDLPSEKIGTTITIPNVTESASNQKSETLEYPDADESGERE